jgi:hypothetical protein
MPLATQFNRWQVLGEAGASGELRISAGVFRYRLLASDPVRGTGPARVPGYRPAQTHTVRYERAPVLGGSSAAVIPRPRDVPGYSSSPLRTSFALTFAGAGTGPGVPVEGSFSLPSDYASAGAVHFVGASRSAQQFRGLGFIIEAAGTAPSSVRSGAVQILVLSLPQEMVVGALGGAVYLAHRIESALTREGDGTRDWARLLWGIVGPEVAIAMVRGAGRGLTAGITLYLGVFGVT